MTCSISPDWCNSISTWQWSSWHAQAGPLFFDFLKLKDPEKTESCGSLRLQWFLTTAPSSPLQRPYLWKLLLKAQSAAACDWFDQLRSMAPTEVQKVLPGDLRVRNFNDVKDKKQWSLVSLSLSNKGCLWAGPFTKFLVCSSDRYQYPKMFETQRPIGI